MAFGTVDDRFWTDDKSRDFSDSGKLLALYLLTCKHRTLIGCYHLPIEYICADLKWTADRVALAMSELAAGERPFIVRDPDGWTAIVNFLRYQKLTSPNHFKALDFQLSRLPPKSPILPVVCKALSGIWRDDWCRRPKILEATPDLLNGCFLDTPKQLGSSRLPPAPAPAPAPDPEPIEDHLKKDDLTPPSEIQLAVDLYHEAAERVLNLVGHREWQRIQLLTDRRKRSIAARLKDLGGIDGWRAMLEKAEASSFVTGRSGRTNGHEHWRPDFDSFFLNPSKITKLMEGAYDDRPSSNRNPPDGGGSGFAGLRAQARQKASGSGPVEN